MSCGKVLKLFLISCLPVLLSVCKLNVDIPDYSLEFEGTKVYPEATIVTVSYKFTAEETYHRCQYRLNRVGGITLDSGQTPFLTAGAWHLYSYDNVNPLDDGIYYFRIAVQVEKADRQYVDLAFLDKEFQFYIDGIDPPDPILDPVPGRYAGTTFVQLIHDVENDPQGSPVKLYYEIDRDPGSPNPNLYSGSPIELNPTTSGHTLWTMVEDLAGNNNGGGKTVDYSFIEILSAINTATGKPEVPINVAGGFFNVKITGYGFDEVTPAEVKFVDYDGTEIWSKVVTYSETEFVINANIEDNLGGGNGKIDIGEGTISLTNQIPNIAVETIKFEIIPPPEP